MSKEQTTPNLLERGIAFFAPGAAANRARSRVALMAANKISAYGGGYGMHGANTQMNAMKAWFTNAGSPDEDIAENAQILRERARDLDAGGGFARGATRTMRTNIVGKGLMLRPNVDAEALGMTEADAARWNKETQREFELWADSKNCDANRQSNFYELQQLAFLSSLISGDAFALLPYKSRAGSPYSLTVRVLEADRVSTPHSSGTSLVIELPGGGKIVDGVEVDKSGEVVAYHVASKHPLSMTGGTPEWIRVPAFGAKTGRPNVLHVMDIERPEQRRGVPLVAPMIPLFKQMARYTDAEIMRILVSAMFAVFLKTTTDGDVTTMPDAIPEEERVTNNPYEMEIGSGTVIQLPPGMEPQQVNPAMPSSQFQNFIDALAKQLGSSIEMPKEVMMKEFNSSYSASRAALLEFWKSVRMRRDWFTSDFCQPIYEEFLYEAIYNGRIHAPGFYTDPRIRKAYTRAEWHGPSQGQLDPVKEANAAILRMNSGLSTGAREAAETNGSDFDTNVIQRRREIALAAGVTSEEADLRDEPGDEEQDDVL